METIEFTLLSKSGVRSSSRMVKNQIKRIIESSNAFDSIVKVEVVCAGPYLETESFFNMDRVDRGVHVGYSYICKGFNVKLFFPNNNIKNTFKLKGNLSKLLNQLNNQYTQKDHFSVV
jgi:hypothetical protein